MGLNLNFYLLLSSKLSSLIYYDSRLILISNYFVKSNICKLPIPILFTTNAFYSITKNSFVIIGDFRLALRKAIKLTKIKYKLIEHCIHMKIKY